MSIVSTALPTVEQAQHELVEMHQELVRHNLVVWTAGNVSARADRKSVV